MIEELGLTIYRCLHPLLKLDGCSCTHCTRSNKDPVPFRVSKIWRQGRERVFRCFEENLGIGRTKLFGIFGDKFPKRTKV